jgi:predicted nucleic acid-binding protein
MNVVVDASVVVKWLVAESDTDKAEALLESYRLGYNVLLAPELLALEVASVLWRRVRQGILLAREAESLFAYFNRIGPVLRPHLDLSGSAFELALAYQHSVYDCLYLALASEYGCDLITADEKLHRAFAPDFPQVRLLRDWQP